MKTQTVSALTGLEQQLQGYLHPVNPDPQFIRVLQHRLTSPPSITIESESHLRALLAIGLGLFSGTLLFWLLRRFWLWVRKP